METLITIILIEIIMLFLFQKNTNEIILDGVYIFKFPKRWYNLMLSFFLIMLSMGIYLFVSTYFSTYDSNNIAVGIFFIIFAILCLFIYIYLRKKIEIQNNEVKIYKMFGKKVIFSLEDITEVKHLVGNKMIFYINNKKVFSIDSQMENFDKLHEIIENLNIKVEKKGDFIK